MCGCGRVHMCACIIDCISVWVSGCYPLTSGGEWMVNNPYTLAIGSEPVRCCEPVLGDLWVGRGNKVMLVDTHMLTFQVGVSTLC